MSRNIYKFLRLAVPFGLVGATLGAVAGGIGGAVVGGTTGVIAQAYTGSPVALSYAYICSGIGATLFGVVGLVVSGCILYGITTTKTGF